jgi:uncharacterized protein (TIGR03435 family)
MGPLMGARHDAGELILRINNAARSAVFANIREPKGGAMRLRVMSKSRLIAGLAGLGLFWGPQMRAQLTLPQDGETLPSFEVATVKPAAADATGSRVQWLPDGFRMENAQLRLVLRNAYGVHSDAQLVGGPEALLNKSFDAQAKMDANDAAQLKAMPREDQQRRRALMMQALLRDRFQLKIHVEMRVLPVYALVAAKGGSKLQPAAPPAPAPETEPGTPAQAPLPKPGDPLPHRPPQGGSMMRMSPDKAEMSVSAGTMAQLAAMLSGQGETEGRIILDKTGLTGRYDWYLTWTPPAMGNATGPKGADAGAADGEAPGLVTALQEQLGLRLEAQKASVQVVVIDHLELPSPN